MNNETGPPVTQQDPFLTGLKQIQRPTLVESFRSGFPKVEVLLYRQTSGEPEKIVLKGVTPFLTVQDLFTLIYVQTGNQKEFHPSYVFLGYNDSETDADEFVPVAGNWFSELDSSKPIKLLSPLDVLGSESVLEEFIDAEGGPRPLQFAPRLRITLEDCFADLLTSDTLTLHAFPLSTVLRLYKGGRPFPEDVWYGAIKPYFPVLESQGPFEPTEAEINDIRPFVTVLEGKLKQTLFLDRLLEGQDFPAPKVTGLYGLSYEWSNPQPNFQGTDVLFFSYPATELCPFVRYVPWSGQRLTKMYRQSELTLPKITDTSVLRQWATEESPIENSDVLLLKVQLREPQPGVPGVYGTFRIFQDGSADFILSPPKGMRALNVSSDIAFLATILKQVSPGLPIDLDKARLRRVILHTGLQLERGVKRIPLGVLRKRIQSLSTYFQELPVPSGEKMTLFLRYKLVSNFVREDRVGTFLSYITERLEAQGDKEQGELVTRVAREFSMTQAEATRRVADWLQGQSELTVANASAQDYISAENPGTDIAIYDQYPFYTFHIFGTESVADLQRICTLMSILFLVPEEDWTASETAGESVRRAEEQTVPLASTVPPPVEAPIQAQRPEPNSTRINGPSEQNLAFLMAYGEEGGEEEGEELEFEEVGFAEAEVGSTPLEPALPPAEEARQVPAEPEPKPEPKKAPPKEDEKSVVAFSFFIDRLKQLDPTLYAYKPPTGVKHYTSNCAANWDRQPLILTKQEFDYLLDIYADDEDLVFIVYGEPDWEKKKRSAVLKKGTEIVYALKYGSDPLKPNYYLCCEFFCLRDRLMIRKDDWLSTKDRADPPKTKPKESCPFCHGVELPIKKRKKPGDNEVVLHRIIKPDTDPKENTRHIYVRFLDKGKHPDGYDLPCCFTSQKDISYDHPAFKKMREAYKAQEIPVANEVSENKESDEDEDDEEERVTKREEKELKREAKGKEEGAVVDFQALQYRISKEYILSTEKYPLDTGKVGICAASLDRYFGQESAQLVARTAIKAEIKPTATGMFRLGVNNSIQSSANSLFSALAPALGLNTADMVADYFFTRITPRVFTSLNFGNLVLEFFNPRRKEPTITELQTFATSHFQVDITKVKSEMSRLKRSYDSFCKDYLLNSSATKQIRHFVHALAEPKLLTENGLLVVTLEYDREPNDPNVQVEVKCPSLGIDADRYAQADILFLTHYTSKQGQSIWEPLVFLIKPATTKGPPFIQEAVFKLTRLQMAAAEFPEALRRRIKEYMSECQSAYRGVFSFQSDVDSRVLIPISRALKLLLPYRPKALVRDTYNHLFAVTVQSQTTGREILVPVSDDGSLYSETTGLHVHLGIQAVPLAPAEDVLTLYKSGSEGLRPLEERLGPVYRLQEFLSSRRIYAFLLGGPGSPATITLPCGDSTDEEVPRELVREAGQKAPFEYEISRDVITEKAEAERDSKPTFPLLLQREDAEQIYQMLRLSFSNWLASEEAGGDLRQRIEQLIDRKDLPVWEKRKRLQLELDSQVLRMLSPDTEYVGLEEPVLLRRDCLEIKDEGTCSGAKRCKWVQESGQCLIHTPQTIQVSSRHSAPALRFFSLRLYDEILRIPKRRQELFTKTVKRVQIPTTNIQIADQWIIPEKTKAWTELLKPSISDMAKESPEFYEEYSRARVEMKKEEVEEDEFKEETEEIEEKEDEKEEELVPQQIKSLLDSKYANSFSMKQIGSGPPLTEFKEYFSIPDEVYKVTDEEPGPIFTPLEASKIGAFLERPVVQIYLQPDRPLVQVTVYAPIAKESPAVIFVPNYPEGPSLLVPTETRSDSVPLLMLSGPILDEISKKVTRVRKLKK